VDPRAGLDDVERRKFLTLHGLELRPLCHPARSQSLYRLRYPGSKLMVLEKEKLSSNVFPLLHPQWVERLVETQYDALHQFLWSYVDLDLVRTNLSHFTYGLNLY
jgi:hypothetical protein